MKVTIKRFYWIENSVLRRKFPDSPRDVVVHLDANGCIIYLFDTKALGVDYAKRQRDAWADVYHELKRLPAPLYTSKIQL